MTRTTISAKHRGYSLLEVLITMFVIAIGLLGLVGLQARALTAEVESASRGQALMLVNEMADRMESNLAQLKTPAGSATYDQLSGGSKTVFGTGYTNSCVTGNPASLSDQAECCKTTAQGGTKNSVAESDICEWDLALKGIGETTGSASKIGGLAGARGCVFLQATSVYEINVVWQGRDATGAVASDLTCGNTAITAGRRGISRRIWVANLSG
ncbi:type IV pilus modification protein PilV [Sulfuritalea sp.]|uniref:type IV pilus modification protein PilV n=1 Tax=Sulfuritalea sp. TaxID=2480090 RepID=UPI00286EAF2D|nr:type IV pilus modification protein PilV [Sulfuritalea sp.]